MLSSYVINDVAGIVGLYAGPPSKVPLPRYLTFGSPNLTKGIGQLVVSSDTDARCYPAVLLYKHVGCKSVVEWIIYPYWETCVSEDSETDSEPDDDGNEQRRVTETIGVDPVKDMYSLTEMTDNGDGIADIMKYVPLVTNGMYACRVVVRRRNARNLTPWNEHVAWRSVLQWMDEWQCPLEILNEETAEFMSSSSVEKGKEIEFVYVSFFLFCLVFHPCVAKKKMSVDSKTVVYVITVLELDTDKPRNSTVTVVGVFTKKEDANTQLQKLEKETIGSSLHRYFTMSERKLNVIDCRECFQIGETIKWNGTAWSMVTCPMCKGAKELVLS